MFQAKEQDKSPETDLNEMEIGDLPDRGFKLTIINIHTKVRRTIHEQSENCNKKDRKYKVFSISFFY